MRNGTVIPASYAGAIASSGIGSGWLPTPQKFDAQDLIKKGFLTHDFISVRKSEDRTIMISFWLAAAGFSPIRSSEIRQSDDGLSFAMDRIGLMGNAVFPQIAGGSIGKGSLICSTL